MRISVLTLFPDMFTGPFDLSIIGRAQKKGIVEISCINIRDYASGPYKAVDDHPYGGGAGMILRVDVVEKALLDVKSKFAHQPAHTILLDTQGTTYTEKDARRLSEIDHLILLCGHYEGIDERIRTLVDEEISIGDYVLTGGELPAMIITDSIVRLLPGVLSKKEATLYESFGTFGLEYPQYTRPEIHNGLSVPPILLSGNHAEINKWKGEQSRIRTKARRPDLLTEQKDSA